jgi:hypothetical protein
MLFDTIGVTLLRDSGIRRICPDIKIICPLNVALLDSRGYSHRFAGIGRRGCSRVADRGSNFERARKSYAEESLQTFNFRCRLFADCCLRELVANQGEGQCRRKS